MAQQKYAYHSTDHTGIVVNWRITCLALQPGLGLFPRRRTAPVNHSDTGFHASIAACAIWKRGTWFPHARDACEARSSDLLFTSQPLAPRGVENAIAIRPQG